MSSPILSIHEIAPRLLNWFEQEARILPWRISPADRQQGVRPVPYNVWLSEIMLQQTTVAAVIPYYGKFLRKWPNIEDLARTPIEEVLKEWAGLGYYTRAHKLHECAQYLVQQHAGAFPKSQSDLIQLPGIGPYTSAAIAAICFDEKVAVVDGNVERVFARLFALDIDKAKLKRAITPLVEKALPDKRTGEFAESVMDLGATICKPKSPDCPSCHLNGICEAYRQDLVDKYPRPKIKKERPVRFGICYLARQTRAGQQQVLLKRRENKGLLSGMTELPGTDWVPIDEAKTIEHSPPYKANWQYQGQITHVFTHFELRLDIYRDETVEPEFLGNDVWWQSLEEDLGLPSVFAKALQKGMQMKTNIE